MKYNKNFNTSFNFYLSNINSLNFCPFAINNIEFSRNGIDAKEAFFQFESTGKIKPTKHPRLFRKLMIFKASFNWHVKQWSEGIEDTYTTVDEYLNTFKNPPEWVNQLLIKSFRKSLKYPFKEPFWDKKLHIK